MSDPRRPVLLVDVDGVLNPFAFRRGQEPPGFTAHDLLGYRVLLAPRHGVWLSALAAEGLFDLAWATTWEHDADKLIAPRVGLPAGLPVIAFDEAGSWGGYTWKLAAVDAFVAGRACAWIDDDLGGDAHAWAARREAAGLATLLISPDPAIGLTHGQVDRLRRWATKQPR